VTLDDRQSRLIGPGRIILAAFCCFALGARAEPPRIAIVIDDVGFQWQLDQRAMALDPPVALAIIPEGPLASRLARQAARQGREVWVHLPMTGLGHDNCQSGLTCLDPDWSPETMRDHLLRQLALVPEAVGINNHQGSEFTSDSGAVGCLVGAIGLVNQGRARPLMVMDSRTVESSQLEHIARAGGLKTLRRRVFLDHSKNPDDLLPAWRRLIALAHREGQAIAIGHSREATLDFLELAIGELLAEGIELVPPSALTQTQATAAIPPLPTDVIGAYTP
jgi:polysaccharide deacetylase 2 family uncharacterized protein YibQ